MKRKISNGSALTAVLLALLTGCGVNNPAPAPGTITGSSTVTVPDGGVPVEYHFSKGGNDYGYISFTYDKGYLEEVTVFAPNGVCQGGGSTAPTAGYSQDAEVVLANSYFIKPDSLHYGRIDIENLGRNSEAEIGFNWIVQTEPGNRELY